MTEDEFVVQYSGSEATDYTLACCVKKELDKDSYLYKCATEYINACDNFYSAMDGINFDFGVTQ